MGAFVLLLLTLVSLSAQAVPLYRYELHLKPYTENLRDVEAVTKKLVAFLAKISVGDGCIDVRRRILIANIKKKDETLDLLMRTPIDPFPLEDLQAELCAGQSPKCALTGSVSTFNTDDVDFQYLWRKDPILGDPKSNHSARTEIASFDTFPMFSSSCKDGNGSDSYFFSERSKESRDLVQRSGVNLDTLVSLRLHPRGRPDNEFWWGFGPPDRDWVDQDYTSTNGNIAPDDILKSLQ